MSRVRWVVFTAAIVLSPSPARANDREDAADHCRKGVEALQKKDYDRAIEQFSEAIRLDPRHADSYFHRGRAHQARNELDRAAEDYSEALRFDPNRADCLYQRATVYQATNAPDLAIDDFTAALARDPKLAAAHAGLGYLYHEVKKEYERAASEYAQALRLDPTIPNAVNNLAWLRATCPEARWRDGKQAVEGARKACELTGWKNAYFLDTLAAAYAESGQFDQAVEWQKKALQIPGGLPKDEMDKAWARLDLYHAKKPYHGDAGARP